MQIESATKFNHIRWIRSLRPENEGVTRRIQEDVFNLLDRVGAAYEEVEIGTLSEMREYLTDTLSATKGGGVPIIYFDTHGDKMGGLEIWPSREEMPWTELYSRLRYINEACQCNLIVVAACCFGTHMLQQLDISQMSAVYAMVSAPEEISQGYLEERIPIFFKALFDSLDLNQAYEEVLSDKMHYYNCQRSLALILAKYFRDSCKGRAARERKERVISQFFNENPDRAKRNLPALREIVRAGIRPRQETIDKIARQFLGPRDVGFKLEDILKLLDQNS